MAAGGLSNAAIDAWLRSVSLPVQQINAALREAGYTIAQPWEHDLAIRGRRVWTVAPLRQQALVLSAPSWNEPNPRRYEIAHVSGAMRMVVLRTTDGQENRRPYDDVRSALIGHAEHLARIDGEILDVMRVVEICFSHMVRTPPPGAPVLPTDIENIVS